MSGPLALVGGDELNPGNEPQDELLVEATEGGRAFVLATAAAGQRPDLAVRHAVEWFGDMGLSVEELPATSRELADSVEVAELAAEGSFFYLVGGDPALVPATLSGSRVWNAVVDAWRRGAALAGSSAGAMALCEWVLLSGGRGRVWSPGLGLVPDCAVVPHFDTFGASWADQVLAEAPEGASLLGIDERTAAVWSDGSWNAMGAGEVCLIAGDGSRRCGDEGLASAGQPRI